MSTTVRRTDKFLPPSSLEVNIVVSLNSPLRTEMTDNFFISKSPQTVCAVRFHCVCCAPQLFVVVLLENDIVVLGIVRVHHVGRVQVGIRRSLEVLKVCTFLCILHTLHLQHLPQRKGKKEHKNKTHKER